MNFQNILKINKNLKVLFCNKLLKENIYIEDLENIKKITPTKIHYQDKIVDVENGVQTANYTAKYSECKKLMKLLRKESRKLLKRHGQIIIKKDGSRKYEEEKDIVSDQPIIYFWVANKIIFYVGKAWNGWNGKNGRAGQHQAGWRKHCMTVDGDIEYDQKAKEENQNILDCLNEKQSATLEVWTIPVHQLKITDEQKLNELSPFQNRRIPQVFVNIIDDLEKIFIFICQPLLNEKEKNGNSVNIETLNNILPN